MTFEKGRAYRTRGGEVTALVCDVRPRSLFVDYSDGPMWTADLDGFVNGSDAPHDRDLLPGAIEDEGGGEARERDRIKSAFYAGFEYANAVRVSVERAWESSKVRAEYDAAERARRGEGK